MTLTESDLRDRGVWHKDGAQAQIRAMANWAEPDPLSDPPSPETMGKIAKNLRAAADALEASHADQIRRLETEVEGLRILLMQREELCDQLAEALEQTARLWLVHPSPCRCRACVALRAYKEATSQ